MTTAEILREARALIDTPEKWTKGNTRGARCVDDALAAVGAEHWCYGPKAALNRALGRPDDEILFVWNDAPETTHADVLAAFDRAIELAEAQS